MFEEPFLSFTTRYFKITYDSHNLVNNKHYTFTEKEKEIEYGK